jgi:hypothetical protein
MRRRGCSLGVRARSPHGRRSNGAGTSRRHNDRVGVPTRRASAVCVRVVRFADVTAERLEGLLARIEEEGGPPPGVPVKGPQLLFDESQGTAIVFQLFDSAEDMRTGDEAFAAMDPGETRQTRVG